MKDLNIIPFIENIFTFIERKASQKYFDYKFALLLTFVTLFFATPAYHYIDTAFQDISWQATYQKADNLLDPLDNIPPDSHAAKKVFRLTVPSFIKVFSLNYYSVYILQCIIGIFLFISIFRLSHKITKDTVSAAIMTTGIAFIYFGKAAFVDIYSWFDAWAYFFLLLALFFPQSILIFLFSTLAAWTDERAVMILPVIIVFHLVNDDKNSAIKLKFNKQIFAASSALVVYLLTRFFLYYLYGLKTPDVNANFMRIFEQTDFWGFGIWTFLEGFWLLVFMSIILLYREKNIFLLVILIIPILWFAIIANIVMDITRSGNYLVPVLFVMLLFLSRILSKTELRSLIFISSFISFIFPAYYINTDLKPFFLWYKPIFIRFIDYLVLHNYI